MHNCKLKSLPLSCTGYKFQDPETLYKRPIQFMQFHVTCCLQTRLLTNNMARNVDHVLALLLRATPFIHEISEFNISVVTLHLHTFSNRIFSSDVFSVWDTGRCNAIFEGAVTRMTILGSHVTDQIPSPKFRSRLYRRSLVLLTRWCELEYSRPSCSWGIDQNDNIWLVFINDLRTVWPAKISKPSLSMSDNLL